MPTDQPVIPVTTNPWGMEWSAHRLPKRHRDEVQAVFPDRDVTDVLVVPTCQHAVVDLVEFGPEADGEKDRLLERFARWAAGVCAKLRAAGHWADYIDPCSGYPMIDQTNAAVYPEVQGLSSLLGYSVSNAGCCKIALHPKWGSAVYPASMFTDADAGELRQAIAQTEAELQGEMT
ncbi:unnamed protein product [Pedinophyceae sp. YPF-701]|nr:unnamed protein product [Pedinophyceae sp. YPF-701]